MRGESTMSTAGVEETHDYRDTRHCAVLGAVLSAVLGAVLRPSP